MNCLWKIFRARKGRMGIRHDHKFKGKLSEGNRLGVLASQHRGLGKWLMKEAEKIVKDNKIKKLSVISGIGVREYYKKLNYELEESYVVKFL